MQGRTMTTDLGRWECSWSRARVNRFTPFGGAGHCLLDPEPGAGAAGSSGSTSSGSTEPAKGGDGSTGSTGAGDGAGGDRKFSQSDIDRVVAKQRRELTEKHLDEINRVKKAAGLTDEERARLEKRSNELEDALLSEKDRAKKEIERVRTELASQVEAEKAKAEQNWQLYTSSIVSTEISRAAAAHKAFNPAQVEAIVRPLCVVEDEKDEKLNPTGKHVVLVKARVKNERGVMETVALSVDKYVESMKGNESFANLFLSERAGGMGYRPGAKKGSGDGADGKGMTSREKIKAGLAAQRGR